MGQLVSRLEWNNSLNRTPGTHWDSEKSAMPLNVCEKMKVWFGLVCGVDQMSRLVKLFMVISQNKNI